MRPYVGKVSTEYLCWNLKHYSAQTIALLQILQNIWSKISLRSASEEGCLSRVTFWAMTVPSFPSEDRQVNLEDLSASYGAFRDAFQFTTVVKSGYLNNRPLEPVLPFSSNPSQQQGTSACCTVAYWIGFFFVCFCTVLYKLWRLAVWEISSFWKHSIQSVGLPLTNMPQPNSPSHFFSLVNEQIHEERCS